MTWYTHQSSNIHTTFHQSHNNSPNHTKHINTRARSVLVLSRDFLGNLILKLNIEPHLVVMFLLNYGLSPNSQSIGFHTPILHIKPPSGDGYPNPSSLGIRIPKLGYQAVTPQTRGSVDYPSTRGIQVDVGLPDATSEKSGRVSFVRGALPKYSTCLKPAYPILNSPIYAIYIQYGHLGP